jgi:hypothetical protein
MDGAGRPGTAREAGGRTYRDVYAEGKAFPVSWSVGLVGSSQLHEQCNRPTRERELGGASSVLIPRSRASLKRPATSYPTQVQHPDTAGAAQQALPGLPALSWQQTLPTQWASLTVAWCRGHSVSYLRSYGIIC